MLVLQSCRVDLDRGFVERDGEVVALRQREADLLRYLTAHPSEDVDRDTLLREVWGYRSTQTRTLDTTVKNLRQKIEPDPRKPIYIRTRRGVGYRFDPPPATGAHGITEPADAYVGREQQCEELPRLITESRLVTVTGTGGVGKTRLVIHVARARHPGALMCDLSSVGDLDGIAAVVSDALDVPVPPGDPIEGLGVALAEHGELVVILDNFEHLVALAPATVGRWLELAPKARFVITSQRSLMLRGERTMELLPLAPEAAARLFRERVRVGVAEGAVRRLVGKLDGLPLAIELAALKAAHFELDTLEALLDRRLDVLAGGHADAPLRHQGLRATLEWSWTLLEEPQRDLMCRLSLFEGPFVLGLVVATLDDDLSAATAGLSGLRGAGWLHPAPGGRLRMLESIREFARERFEAQEVQWREAVTRDHVAAFARWGRDETLFELETDERGAFTELLPDREDILASIDLAIALGEQQLALMCLRVAARVGVEWGPAKPALDRCARFIARWPHPRAHLLRVRLRNTMGAADEEADAIDWAQLDRVAPGDPLEAEIQLLRGRHAYLTWDAEVGVHLRRAVDLCTVDPVLRVRALQQLANWLWHSGRVTECREVVDQGVHLAQSRGIHSRADSLRVFGAMVLGAQGRFEEALAAIRGAPRLEGDFYSLAVEAQIRGEMGEWVKARELFQRALEEARRLGLVRRSSAYLVAIMRTELALGNHDAVREAGAWIRSRGLSWAESDIVLAVAAVRDGRLEEAEERLERALTQFGPNSPDLERVETLARAVEIWLGIGRRDRADAALAEVQAWLTQRGPLHRIEVLAQAAAGRLSVADT